MSSCINACSASEKPVPAILLTGYPDDSVRERALSRAWFPEQAL
jgi:hypothetical protein